MGADPAASVARCGTCAIVLERSTGRSLDLALACSAATLVLLVPANLLRFMTTSVFGASVHSRLSSCATEIWHEGWPWLAIVIGLVVVVMPVVRFSLLTAALAAVRFGRVGRWTGPTFRAAQAVQAWAMADVFLLGLWIAYARLSATMSVVVEWGALCFVAAGVLTLVTRACLPEAEVWARIAPDREIRGAVVPCDACGLVADAGDEGNRCRRCGARLTARRPGSLEQTSALTLAAFFLYVIANVYPMATVPLGLESHRYTVLEGVGDLFKAHLLGLALLVLVVSFAIPLLKLIGLGWFVASAASHSGRLRRTKTRLYHLVEEIGRWSMTDPFAIACFVPLIQYNALVYGRAEAGASVFSFVVVATMTAARRFDPRLLWDEPRR